MEQKRLHGFIWDYALSMTVYFAGTSTVIVKLTEYFDMPLALSNLVVGMPGTLMFLELLGGYAYRRTTSRRRYLQGFGIGWRICLPLMLFTALLPKSMGPWILFVLYAAMCTCYRMSMPAYNAWTVWAARDDESFYSKRDMAFMPLYTVALFASGILIEHFESGGTLRRGFWVMGLAELTVVACSLVFLLLRMAPPQEVPPQKAGFWQSVLQPLRDVAYRKVLWMNIVWNFSSAFVGTFSSVYQIRVLGISYFAVVLWATIGNIARCCFIPVFARFAAWFGWKMATLFSLGMLTTAYLLWATISPANMGIVFPLINLFSSIAWAAYGIGMFKYQIQYTQEETRSSYFSVSSALSGIAAAAGTFLCSGLVSLLERSFAMPPYRVVFLVGVMGALATLWLIWKTPYQERV